MRRRSRFLTCAGQELHVSEWGREGAPVVLLWHGLARTGRDFDELGEALSRSFHVVAPDLPGRGLSGWSRAPRRDYGFPAYEGVAVDLADRLGAERLRWVGTSLGGALGILAASGRMRERISHLVINDVGPEVPDEALDRIAHYVGNPPIFDHLADFEAWLRTVYAPFGTNSDAFWRRMATSSARRTDEGRWTVHYDPAIASQLAAGSGAFDLWSAWSGVPCPVLLLRGAESDVLTPSTAEEMVRRNPRCRRVDLAGYGHAPTLATAEEARLIEDFLLD